VVDQEKFQNREPRSGNISQSIQCGAAQRPGGRAKCSRFDGRAATGGKLHGVKLEWPVLRSRNFQFFLAGQALSLLGESMQQVALSWLIFRTTHSAAILGIAGFLATLPAAIAVPFAGASADRSNPRSIIVRTQIAWTLVGLALALSAIFGRVNVVVLLVSMSILGTISGVDTPVRQMFVARLVDSKEELGSGVSFHSLVYDGTRMLGPALGGFLLARISESPVFLANGLCHALALVMLLSIRLPSRPGVAASERLPRTLAEGLGYAAHVRPVLAILLLSAVIGFAGSSYMVLLPVMASVLSGGPNTLGLLWSAVGLGAVAGGLVMSGRRGVAGFAELIVAGVTLFAAGIFVFSLSRLLGVSLLALGIAGFGLTLMVVSCNTVLLTITDPERHGRVLGLFTLSYMAAAPAGNLYIGFLASRTSAPTAIAAGGVISLLAAAAFLFQIPSLRLLVRSRVHGSS
jgi:MFS family permease